MSAKHPVARDFRSRKRLGDHTRSLTEVEPTALSMLNAVDLRAIDPVIVRVGGEDPLMGKLWDYWRYTLSSAPQRPVFNMGRQTRYFVFDKASRGLLAVFALTDTPVHNPFFAERWGWTEIDCNQDRPGSMQNRAQIRSLHTIVALRRCLPLFEFGRMTGGKCVTALALTRDILRPLEEQYSFKLSLFYASALHGRSSQYNRLDSFGLQLAGIGPRGEAYYFAPIRKKAETFLAGQADLGKFAVRSFADNLTHWRERWLVPRMESQGVFEIDPDPDRYRLSNRLHNHESMSGNGRDDEEGGQEEEGGEA